MMHGNVFSVLLLLTSIAFSRATDFDWQFWSALQPNSYVTQGLVSWLDLDSGFDENGLWLDMIEHDPEYPDDPGGTLQHMDVGQASASSWSSGLKGVTHVLSVDDSKYTKQLRMSGCVDTRFHASKPLTIEVCASSAALKYAGLFDDVWSFINADPKRRILWDAATALDSDDPMIAEAVAALMASTGLPFEQVDAIMRSARRVGI